MIKCGVVLVSKSKCLKEIKQNQCSRISSQTAVVRSKEQVAMTWPNSGWAQITLHTDPVWAYICTSHNCSTLHQNKSQDTTTLDTLGLVQPSMFCLFLTNKNAITLNTFTMYVYNNIINGWHLLSSLQCTSIHHQLNPISAVSNTQHTHTHNRLMAFGPVLPE